MALRELISPSLTDLFVREIEGMILSGELQVGQRLPTEREMAAKMKVSLAVINGGITRLTAKGFLRVVPRKGVYVADYIREGNVTTLEAILEYGGNYFQSDILEGIVEMRKICELPILEKACALRTEDDLNALEKIISDFEKTEDFKLCSDLGFKFHHEVSVASKNLVYPLIISTFREIYRSYYYTMLNLRGKEGSSIQLKDLLDCIRRQDVKAAKRKSLNFIEQWHRTFQAHFQEGQKYHRVN